MLGRPSTRRAQLRRATAGAVGLLAGAGGLPHGGLPHGGLPHGGLPHGGLPYGQVPVAHAQSQGDGPSAVVYWNNVALEMIRQGRPDPTVAARALAMLHTCIYDAWSAYDAVAVPTRPELATLKRPAAERTLENKQRAIGYAAFGALFDLFPFGAPSLLQALERLGYSPLEALTDRTKLDPSAPSGIGNAAAVAVAAFRGDDGANQTGDQYGGMPYSDTFETYQPVNTPDLLMDPNRWQPLQISYSRTRQPVAQRCVTPHWGKVVPFALASGDQFRPAALPPMYPDPAYVAQAEQVLDYSANLTDAHKAIGEYWADGPNSETPPGHWCLLAQWVSKRDALNLDQDVKLFFALANAMLDASIACWDCKMTVDYVRPVTAIRFLWAGQQVQAWAGPGQGIQTIDGAAWVPYRPLPEIVPPFPEYVAGHSTFSAAGAEVLKRFTGRDDFGAAYTIGARKSIIEPGLTPAENVTLSWATYSEAADQAGLSRRYGGIHFELGDLEGRKMGRQVGAVVWDKALSYFKSVA